MKRKKSPTKAALVCDICGNPIFLSRKSLKEHKFPDGIYISYFTCKFCRGKFVFLVTDAALRYEMEKKGKGKPSRSMHEKADALKCEYLDRVKELP